MEEGILKIKFDPNIEERYSISIEGAILKCLKHMKRYGEVTMPNDIMRQIFYFALRGLHCKENHLDISHRISLCEFLEKHEIDDPYLQDFLKISKKVMNED